MKNEQGQQPEAMNSNALGNISVLSPSQRREQERLRKEKEAKDAAEKEKRRIAAAKRKAAQEAAEAEERRKEILSRIPLAILGAILGGVVFSIVTAVVLFFVVAIAGTDLSILRWSIQSGALFAIGIFAKKMMS